VVRYISKRFSTKGCYSLEIQTHGRGDPTCLKMGKEKMTRKEKEIALIGGSIPNVLIPQCEEKEIFQSL